MSDGGGSELEMNVWKSSMQRRWLKPREIMITPERLELQEEVKENTPRRGVESER